VAFRLQLLEPRELVSIGTRWILVITTLFTIVVCASAESVRAPLEPRTSLSSGERASLPDDQLFDFYGNEVSDAVARYKLDLTGSLYEEHSPETELPRLKPPKS